MKKGEGSQSVDATDLAKGVWALAVILAVLLGLVFLVPLFVHLLILLPQLGWEVVS